MLRVGPVGAFRPCHRLLGVFIEGEEVKGLARQFARDVPRRAPRSGCAHPSQPTKAELPSPPAFRAWDATLPKNPLAHLIAARDLRPCSGCVLARFCLQEH